MLTVRKTINEKKKKIFKYMLAITLLFKQSILAYATTLDKSILVTGTNNLLNDVSKAIMAVSGSITTVLLIAIKVKMQIAENEEVASLKKWERRIMKYGVGVFVISGLFNIILNYYK